MSRCYAYIVAYISRLEIGNVVLRPARLEVGHYDIELGDGEPGNLVLVQLVRTRRSCNRILPLPLGNSSPHFVASSKLDSWAVTVTMQSVITRSYSSWLP